MRARELCKTFVSRFTKEHVVDSASSGAFWLFLSLLPLAAVTMMIVAKSDMTALQPIIASVPASSRDLVSSELAHLAAWHGGTVGPLSAAVFVWLASSGVHAILDGFDRTLAVERPWWKKRLLACAICVGLSVVVALVGLAFGLLERGITRDAMSLLTATPLRYVVAFAAEIGFVTALFTVGVSRASTSARRRRWPGAIVAVTLQTLLGVGYVFYVERLGRGAYAAAGLATIALTMMVVFFFTLSLLVGVTFNAMLAERVRTMARPA